MGGTGVGLEERQGVRGRGRKTAIPLIPTYPDAPPHPYLFIPESESRESWTSAKL